MKAHVSKLAAAALLVAVSLLFTSCFYMPGVSGANARAGLILPRYIVSNTTSLALIVGGPGMSTIYASYPAVTSTISIDVPAGHARTFTLLMNGLSATLQGVATVDLLPGETKEITLNPTMFASQIIVPDYLNSRLVQISDMSGTGWTTFAPGFQPYDVDFDNQGRIYMSSGSYSNTYISRIDDISGANPTPIAFTAGTYRYTYAIAMDNAHDLLYYTDGSNLYRIVVAPAVGAETSFPLSSLSAYPSLYITGVAVDSDGFVYLAGTYYTASSIAVILKVDPTLFPSSIAVVASYSGTLVYPWDILVRGDYVYVSDSSGKQIVRLTRSLGFVDSFSGPASDPFLGPERFVAILNKPITVMDEGISTKRVVSFNDMTGAGWTTYGSLGNSTLGPGYFEFFNSSG